MGVNLYPHNQETYKRMIEMFKTDKRVGVVQPTGTGKSFLMLKWIEDHIDEDIVVLSPSNVLFTQLHRYAHKCGIDISNVDMHTYQKLDRAEEISIEDISADKIILDEFHRTGAEKWGESIDILLESHKDSQILGLTATPIRYLDRSKNMADEIFNNNLAKYMTLLDAIDEGILPVPKYIPVWYDYNDKLTKYQEDINNIKTQKEREECERLLKELKRNLQNSYGAETIFKDNMPNNHGKYIVFCMDNKHLKRMKKKMTKWLRDINTNIHHYITVSDKSDKDEQVQKFIDDNDNTAIKLLFSINRLNEGLHVEGIDGVIMLRPTESGIIYLQQMGRAFATYNETPIIFDMVNNYQSVKAVDPDSPDGEYYNIFQRYLYGSALFRKRNLSSKIFGIFEDAKNFNEIFKNIESILYPDYNKIWQDTFEIVKEFKQKYSRDPRGSDIYNGINIGNWIRAQRRSFKLGILPKEREEKLNSIGINLIGVKRSWEENFQLLKEFREEYGRNPKQNEIYKDISIGLWLTSQKTDFKHDILLKEKEEKLKSIGVNLKRRSKKTWEENFELLKEFKEEFDRDPRQTEIYKGENIGTWVSNQKRDFIYNILLKEKEEKLKSIGIKLYRRKIKSWEDSFEIVKEFIENHDISQIDISYIYKEVKIKTWIASQKTNFKNGKLSEEKIKLLESIGIKLQCITWEDKFKLLKEFKEEYGRNPKQGEIYKGENIGNWINSNKTNFKNGKLSEEKIKLLESIGVNLQTKSMTTWEDKFELLKEFKEKYGRDPKRCEIYKGIDIGTWVTTTLRTDFTNNKLSEEKIKLLESINIEFRRKNKKKNKE